MVGYTDAFFANEIVQSIQTPFKKLPDECRVDGLIVINLLKNMFSPGSTKWKDLSDNGTDEPIKVLFFTLAKMVENMNTLRSEMSNRPNVESIVEELVSESGTEEGLRVFFFLTNPEANFGDALVKLIKHNGQVVADIASGKIQKFKPQPYQCYMKVMDPMFVATMYNTHNGETLELLDADELYREVHSPSVTGSLLNPLVALKPEYCFDPANDTDSKRRNEYLGMVCEQQRDIRNYFDMMSGVAAQNFEGFPRPELVHRYRPKFFTPQRLSNALLPNFMRKKFLFRISELSKRKDELEAQQQDVLDKIKVARIDRYGQTDSESMEIEHEAKLEEYVRSLRASPNSYLSNDDRELLELSYRTGTLVAEMDNVEDEIKKIPITLLESVQQHLQPESPISRILMSGTRLEENFAENNDIIRLRLDHQVPIAALEREHQEGVAMFVNLRRKYMSDPSGYKRDLNDLQDSFADSGDNENKDAYERDKQRLRMKHFYKNGMSIDEVGLKIQEYIFEKADLKDKYDPKTYSQRFRTLRKSMVQTVWHVFMTSRKVTPVVMNARRWYNGLTKEKQFVSLPQSYKNLSIFGNMMVRILRSLDAVKNIDNQFQLTILVLLNVMCTYKYNMGDKSKSTIKPNIFLSGPAGAGKSFAIITVSELTLPGSTLNANHITEQAFNVKTDLSDVHFLLEETPFFLLGINPKDGKEVPVNPSVKHRMSSGQSTTLSFDKDEDGNRIMNASYSRASNSGTFCSNHPSVETGGTKGPLADRVLDLKATHRKRNRNLKGVDTNVTRDFAHRGAIIESVQHIFHLNHFYLLLWDQMITARALPEINDEEAEINGNIVLGYLSANNIERPSDRHFSMYKEICRAATMMGAIESEFFSEIGLRHRVDLETMVPKAFNPQIMVELVKWGVVTQEISIFVISLMENIWIPNINVEITNILATKLNTWPAVQGKTEFMLREPGTYGGELGQYDMRYLATKDGFHTLLFNKILGYMEDKLSQQDIRKVLSEMQHMMIKSKQKGFYTDRTYEEAKDGFDKNRLESELNTIRGRINQITKETQQVGNVLVDAELKQVDPEIKKVIIERGVVCTATLKELLIAEGVIKEKLGIIDVVIGPQSTAAPPAKAATPPVKASATPTGHIQVQSAATQQIRYVIERQTLRDVPGSREELIHLLKMDIDPKDKSRRICIAVQAIGMDFTGLLMRAIKNISHRYQDTRTYITGFNKKRVSPFENKEETLYQFFDTIEMKPDENRKDIKIGNKNYIDDHTREMFNVFFQNDVEDSDTVPLWVLDKHSEELTFQQHWKDCHIDDNNDTRMAYPNRSANAAWQMRNHSYFDYAKGLKWGVYPDDHIEAIDASERVKQVDSKLDLKKYGASNRVRRYKSMNGPDRLEPITSDLLKTYMGSRGRAMSNLDRVVNDLQNMGTRNQGNNNAFARPSERPTKRRPTGADGDNRVYGRERETEGMVLDPQVIA